MLLPSDYRPPLPPFFFFCGAFFRVPPEAAGFCCRGGTTLLAGAVDEPDADPGLGEVGGLLAILLASLKRIQNVSAVTLQEKWFHSRTFSYIEFTVQRSKQAEADVWKTLHDVQNFAK